MRSFFLCNPRLSTADDYHPISNLLFVLSLIIVAFVIPVAATISSGSNDSSSLFNPVLIGNIVAVQMAFNRPRKAKRTVNKEGKTNRKRTRRSVRSIFREYGESYTRRAMRMSSKSFWKLLSLLEPSIELCRADDGESNRCPQRAPNGSISNAVRLAVALRYFASGQALDLMIMFAISYTEVFRSVWLIVDAINICEDLSLSFPSDHARQRQIAAEFFEKSSVGFDICCGAIDCMLIWTNKPSSQDLYEMGNFGELKYMCGRKGKYGLILQGISDALGRFLDVEIRHPARTGDYIAFETSKIKTKLQKKSFLADGLCFFGDCAYVNETFMATPYKGKCDDTKDDYNFYHSQLRINVECAFGMLVTRWSILRKCMPQNVPLVKVPPLVRALCCLHNFCIDERESSVSVGGISNDKFTYNVPAYTDDDELDLMENDSISMRRRNSLGIEASGIPVGLLNDENEYSFRHLCRLEERIQRAADGPLPRERLLNVVKFSGKQRPDYNLKRNGGRRS